jgi:hypothetical protein
MATFHTYHVRFSYDDEAEAQIRKFQAASPGHAFEKCLQEYPGCKLIEGWRENGLGANYGCITYTPPSTVRIVAEPAPKAEETRFPFYDDCISHRPFPR